MAQGRIDAIALTNLGQVRRLMEVAQARGCEGRLREGLARTLKWYQTAALEEIPACTG